MLERVFIALTKTASLPPALDAKQAAKSAAFENEVTCLLWLYMCNKYKANKGVGRISSTVSVANLALVEL